MLLIPMLLMLLFNHLINVINIINSNVINSNVNSNFNSNVNSNVDPNVNSNVNSKVNSNVFHASLLPTFLSHYHNGTWQYQYGHNMSYQRTRQHHCLSPGNQSVNQPCLGENTKDAEDIGQADSSVPVSAAHSL